MRDAKSPSRIKVQFYTQMDIRNVATHASHRFRRFPMAAGVEFRVLPLTFNVVLITCDCCNVSYNGAALMNCL